MQLPAIPIIESIRYNLPSDYARIDIMHGISVESQTVKLLAKFSLKYSFSTDPH